MVKNILYKVRIFGEWLASAYLLFFCLPLLMALLVLGTIAQRYIGLYESQKLFFGSFIFWIGPVPTPGAYTIIAFIAAGLVAKLALYSPPRKEQLGIILAHVSILLLLIGGMVTALTREEGYMMLAEGEQSNQVQDYQRHELVIRKNGVQVAVLPEDALRKGTTIEASGFVVKNYCHHCTADFSALANPKEEEERRPAIQIIAGGKTIIVSEAASQPVSIGDYELILEHEVRTLPVSITLRHFDKEEYPGTAIARSYESDVGVKDGLLEWNATISMNTPLRTHGYTFYQSSFLEQEGKRFTVLAVVRNSGALFPYIAVTLLCVGLGLHAVLTLLGRRIS